MLNYWYNINKPHITKKYEYVFASDIIDSTTPIRTGYKFMGWKVSDDVTIPNLSWLKVTENKTLTGVWVWSNETPYTVNHMLKDLEWSGYTIGKTQILNWTTNKTGYATWLNISWFSSYQTP